MSLFDDPFVQEGKAESILAWAHFRTRLIRHGAIAAMLVAVSLGIGMAGYMGFEKLSAVDAFLNASMILGGMGPVATISTGGGKIFAGLYALYSGLVFLVVGALLLAPVVHRVLHRFHWEVSENSDNGSSKE
jgi:UPF0716 family protein affecting phage T7 exclusion